MAFHHRQSHPGQPHPDLPVIFEEGSGTPASSSCSSATANSAANDDDDDDDDDTTAMEEIDMNGDDDTSSNAESYANSYAFTLDNVGFDEENSLVGSVVGSVIGRDSTGSLLHTPPLQYSPKEISNHERKLHRETCRTLGLPYSEDTLDGDTGSTGGSSPSSGSGSDGKDDSVLGSISVSSGSADELELRRRKIDKMWPWPTTTSNKATKKLESELDKRMNNVNNIDTTTDDAAMKQEGSPSWSSYTNRWKEAMTSFSERLEDAYQKANNDPQNTPANNGGEYAPPPSSNENENSSDTQLPQPNNEKRMVLFKRGWVDSYKEANPLARLTVATTILFMLLCIIVILATVGVSNSKSAAAAPSSSSVGNDNGGLPDVMTMNDLMDLHSESSSNDNGSRDSNNNSTATIDIIASVPSEMSAAHIVTNTTEPTAAPSYTPTTDAPTSSPFRLSPALSGGVSCGDNEGRFENIRGRSRECHWLTKNNGDAIYSDRLDSECGVVETSSELGLNCRHACRAYNGCLLLPGGGEGDGEAVGGTKEERVQPTLETSFPTGALTNNPTMKPTMKPTPTPEPTISPAMVTAEPTEEETEEDTEDETTINTNDLPTFTDARGRERQCWWLDIRNYNQRQIRRDVNCVEGAVQATCPSSCVDYGVVSSTMVMNSQVLGQVEGGSLAVEELVYGGNNDDDESGSDNDESANHEDDDAADVVLTAPALQQQLRTSGNNSPSIIEMHHHDPLPQDTCYDGNGYYLNNHGQPQQCTWLINNSDDPTDETRRIQNCGYRNSEYPEGTDLGRMCKNTCGTC